MAAIKRERVAEAMQLMGLSQAELARRAGVSAATIQQILNGKIKRSRSLREISDALEVSDKWLVGLTEDRSSYLVISRDPEDQQITSVPYSTYDGEQRKFKQLKLSAFFLDEITGGEAKFGFVMARVSTGAMAPTLMPNDNILMRVVDEFDGLPGSIWMIEARGTVLFRRVKKIDEKTIYLTADNPMVPSSEMAPDEVRFVGEVVWQGRRINP